MKMDLKQLGYFVEVTKAGSFSRAATLVGIAQPALSRQIRQLEAEVEQTLLIRTGRGVNLTNAGEKMYAHAVAILKHLELAKDEVGELKGAPVGNIAIGMPATIAKLVTVPFVSEFHTKFPRAKLRIVEGLSTYLKEFLLGGRLDIAVLYNVPSSQSVNIVPLLKDELYLISARSDVNDASPVKLEELATIPLIVPAKPSAIRSHLEHQLGKAGKKPNIICEIDAISPTLELVAARQGSTVLSRNALRAWSPGGFLIARPIRPKIQTDISIVFSSRGPMTHLQKAAGELLRVIARPQLAKPKTQTT